MLLPRIWSLFKLLYNLMRILVHQKGFHRHMFLFLIKLRLRIIHRICLDYRYLEFLHISKIVTLNSFYCIRLLNHLCFRHHKFLIFAWFHLHKSPYRWKGEHQGKYNLEILCNHVRIHRRLLNFHHHKFHHLLLEFHLHKKFNSAKE